MTEETNKKKGTEFENKVKQWFEAHFKSSFFQNKKLQVGKAPGKEHRFDLVNETKRIAIECKCYTWTKTGNIPSAKLSTLNEAVFFLSFLRDYDYKTIIVMNKEPNPEKNETLAEYYFRIYRYLLGETIIAEFDQEKSTMRFSPGFKSYNVGDKLPWENEEKVSNK